MSPTGLTLEDPNDEKHWLNLSTCLKALKYTVAPMRILKTALLWHPQNIDLQHSFAQSMAEMGQLTSYQQTRNCWKRRFSELSNEHIFSRKFLEISSEIINHADRRELAQQWEARQLTPETGRLWADHIHNYRPNRRIRIGYLSADWRNHPVGRFMLPILKNHNQNKFEVCTQS